MTAATFLGDSFTHGTGAIDAAHAYCFKTASRLGWTAAVTTGDYGFAYTGASSFAIKDLAAVLAANPDAVVIEGGFHDVGVDPAVLGAAAAALLASLSSIPQVIVLSPIYGSAGGSYPKSYVAAVSTILKAAAANAGRQFIDLANLWVTGTGTSTAPTGDGNADVYINGSVDALKLHPTQAGHDYLGTRLAFALKAPATGLDF